MSAFDPKRTLAAARLSVSRATTLDLNCDILRMSDVTLGSRKPMRRREFMSPVDGRAVAVCPRGVRRNPQQRFSSRRVEEEDVYLSVFAEILNDLGYI